MNGKVAKVIRRRIYGDQSLKQVRPTEILYAKVRRILVGDPLQKITVDRVTGTITCVKGGMRQKYQEAKRVYRSTGILPKQEG